MNLLVRVCDYERMNVERLSARLFVGLGAFVWLLAAASAYTGYWGPTLKHGVGEALVLGVTALAVLVVGWMFERMGALLVFLSAVGAVIYGIIMGWEVGVFVTVGLAVIVPMIMAGLMFLTAAETQSVCDLEEKKR